MIARSERPVIGDVWGVVPLVGRSTLAFERLHGTPLWRHAVAALAEVVSEPVLLVEDDDRARLAASCRQDALPVRVVGADTWPDVLRRTAGRSLLVHDPLCPLVPHDLLTEFCRRSLESPGTSYAAYRPVTDTVKTAVDGRIVGTIDREQLAALTSPVLVAAASVSEAMPMADAQGLLSAVRSAGPTELVVAPSIARRVDDVSAIHLLECVDELERRLRHGLSDARSPRTP